MQMKKMLQKKKCLSLKTFALAILMVLFAMPAKAQQKVYMHTGSMTVPSSGSISFYDSGGESHGPEYYWERWFQRNEDFTFTFSPAETGKKIKVTFNEFTAYLDNGGYNHAIGNNWSMRLNTAELSVYDGDAVDDANLITTYTGNMTGEFSVVANGPITFYFHSYGYREEGWQATVECVDSYELQKPQISFEACSDAIVINANNKGAEIYYTTDGNDPVVADPLTGATLYEGPFNVAAGTTIKAIARLNNTNSAVASKQFTADDVTPTPGVPTITREMNTITMTPAAISEEINETYYVWYTTDGSEPTTTNGQRYTGPFEWHTPNTVFKAVTRAESCSDKISTKVEFTFENVKVITPTITFSNGNATITCNMPGVTVSIYYTTDGSTPTTSSTPYSGPFAVTYGTTVKAFAVVTQTGFDPSDVASEIYVPEGGSGADGTVVILDDREDHSWSYYSDGDQPIHSLNPVDVKITYFGNGTNTVSTSNNTNPGNNWSANATGVQVSHNETENTFIYLKTLERADGDAGTGNCAYTTIPNPFSKRPTYGSGDTRWRGFYGWRVKAVRGGSIQNYAVGSTIDAETEVTFVPDGEYGMEVELEALWARAYVKTGNANTLDAANTLVTNLDGGSYERNFFVITSGNTDNAINRTQNPVTITNRYPDGTSGGSLESRIQNSFTCNNDTKFEFVVFRGGNNYCATLSGNGHDLVVGRGVTGYNNGVCATTIQGLSSASTTNFNFRIESGTYTNLRFMGGSGLTSGKMTSIIGSDYDRATTTNTLLRVTTDIVLSEQGTVGSSNAVGTEAAYCTVKSGNFDLGTYGGNYQFYFSSNSGTIYASRTLVIEGGIFSDVAGGLDSETTSIDHDKFTLRIKGGTINGAVFGAAQYANAWGNRRFVITGGDFQGWIAGGANGTREDRGTLTGISYVYVGGNANVTGNNTVMNRAIGGNVFGAGCGYSTTSSSGQVTGGTNVVIADNAVIQRGVYGGGSYGFTTSTANVYILGGTINAQAGGVNGTTYTANIKGGVFGGACQNQGGITNVTMKDGTVNGSLYGGSNYTGTIAGLATVSISGGAAENVYGGGLGASTSMEAGTVVNVSNGTINNNVYGGGEEGTVTGNTNVTVSGGTMKNVYGAGKGGNTTAQVSGQTFVTINGGTISESVYGGGENGDVMADDGGSTPTQTKTLTVRLYGYHNQGFQNRRDRLVITVEGETNSVLDYRWPQYNPTGGYVDRTITVPCDKDVTCTYTNTGYGNANNIRIVISDETETLFDQNGRPSSGVIKTFNFPSDPVPAEAPDLASTVTVTGGSITGDVFGGGRMGKTGGSTEVDIKGGTIRGSVFGGAYGATGSVYVAGMHSVNIMGGRIFKNVYGGSRNANDALAFTGYNTTETAMSSVVNISAGQVDEQVYAAGYFGQTYGSVYVFVGKNAILNAPNCAPSFGDENENMYKTGKLLLAYNVWAGGDWGTFDGGSFGAPTVSGYSDIYVDGDGYDTETSDESAPSYMNIKGSLLGCGTSCDAGTQGRGIYVRNYGHANGGSKADFNEPFSNATRSFFSIQRADTLIIDNSHINFTGQAKINSLDATEKYAIYSFDKTVRMTSGSSLFLNAPVFQIIDFWSATVDDLYNGINAVYTPIAYNGLGATGGAIDNKVRVNGGNYIEIYHDKMINGTTPGYGMLNGFAHMMVAESNADNTCAYARPKQCVPTSIDNNLDNPSDGGWVSYNPDENTFSIGTYSDGTWDPIPNTGGSDQIPYENHTTVTKAGEQYFRIWRVGGMYSEREGVLNAYADGTESFNYVDVTIKLPAWRSSTAYYQFQTTGTGANLNTTIDYGPDVMTYATAIASASGTTQNWVHFVEADNEQVTGPDATAQTQITQNPNVNFGLVTLAGAGMTLDSPVSSQGGLIVCPESDEFLAGVNENMETVNTFTCSDNTVEPQVTFRLTYSNQISTNMTWDPMFITLVQCDANGNITDIVKISLTINTYTTINNVFTTQTYAIMDGNHMTADTYTAKVILPTFALHDYSGDLSQFTLTGVTFEPNNVDATEQECWEPKGSTYNFTHFAMEIGAARNEDNSDGWNGTATGTYDSHNVPANGILLGETGARTPFAFDFTLTYNGNNNGVAFNEDSEHPALLGVLTFTIRFTNYAEGNPNDNYSQNLTIKVQVIRRGVGKVFYLDGQNGSNANSALYPNDAALSLSYIFNRCGYMPGDIIYIVNTVDVNKNLEWSGSAYNGVTIYRYPGGHPLTTKPVTDQQGNPLYYTDETQTETTTTQTEWPVTYTPVIVDNEDNEAFTGTLVAVGNKGNLTIRDITLDGHMSNHTNPWTQEVNADAGVTAESPMITIASGGTVTLTNGSMLQQNNSTVNGGAVAVDDGGTLKMNQDASIMNNVTGGQGGAVYMAGTMIVSDAVQIIDNTSGTTANNVYLTTADKVIQIGTTDASDEFGELSADAQIGVTKTLYGNIDGYTEVVKVETTNEIPWLAGPFERPNTIIFHDGHKYELEEYSDPTYLYWIGTWVTVQDWNPEYESADDPDYDPNDFAGHLDNIDTPAELAWLISYVNGYNGAEAHPNAVATITADIDMNESIWVPIGNTNTPYTGTFEGNGHVISGIHSILVNDNAAMFGVTQNATIQNVEAVVYFDGNSINKGTFIGTMTGGTLANVEAAGALIGKANTINMGGLVGLANGTSQNRSLIHSGFSVNTITAEKATTVVGGLVGSLGDVVTDENDVTTNYYADLYNSYANVTYTGTPTNVMGGLVGINNEGCIVENCYVINPINTSAVFAYTNNGTVDYCYAADGTNATALFANGTHTTTPVGYGTYDDVLGRKELGYMYGDNVVTAQTTDTTYVRSKIIYADYRIKEWPGLLSTLNQWVKANPRNLNEPAPWFRPTSGDINGDLPLLGFKKDNSLSTAVYGLFNEPYNYLHYGAFDATNNGLDNLLTLNAGKSAYMFLYGNATKVVGETGNNQLFINEDAVLIQDPIASSKDGEPQYKTINATVGITFDNSCRNAYDYWGNKLTYDWHMMATPLSNAKMGTKYSEYETDMSHSDPALNWGDVTELNDSYFPNGLIGSDVKWDFYSYYEPQYHWINYKRDKYNHFHYDLLSGVHENIVYTGSDQGADDEESANVVFTPGKGYMMAISQDSYMSSTGTLNNGNNGGVTIELTNQEPDNIGYSKGWNLIGNPYQAYLDLSQIDNGSFSFYIYDADQDVYAPVTDGQSENPCIPSMYIHPHQAFFMYFNPEGTETTKDFTFDYDLATTTNQTGSYYRGREGQVNYPLVNLFAENERGNHDLTIIELHRPELGGATKVSAMCNANFEIAASYDGDRYGILFTPEGTERVPVHFTTEENGVFTLRWSMYNGDFTSLRLVDNKTGVNYDMLANDHYTFEASTDDYASRFYITYTCTGVDEEVMYESDNFAFFDGSEWVVNGKGQLDVIDMTGRVLYAVQLNNEQNRVNLDGFAAGVYLLRVIDNKVVRTQKIIVR